MKKPINSITFLLPVVALLSLAACDRDRNDREHANGTSAPQMVPTKTGEMPADGSTATGTSAAPPADTMRPTSPSAAPPPH
jgi:hypothetical protein